MERRAEDNIYAALMERPVIGLTSFALFQVEFNLFYRVGAGTQPSPLAL